MAGEVNRHQPGCDDVDEMVEKVGVSDAVYCGVDSKDKEQDIGNVSKAAHGVKMISRKE